MAEDVLEHLLPLDEVLRGKRNMIKLYAFRWVPPFAQGLVRDLRVRWALEEAAIPYEENLIGPDDQKSKAYRALQPFGQVPAIEDDGMKLFESGAIVMYLAERSSALMPEDAAGRARARAWMFSALNSIEPFIMNLSEIDLFTPNPEAPAVQERRKAVVAQVMERLSVVDEWLGDREFLEDRFTAGDLLMTTVIRIPRQTDILSRFPRLDAYRKRNEARPAFVKALAAQMAPFARNAPPQAAIHS
jgi:glutathione S-transferase